jgi:nicotinate phosphoribosyltransferase
MAIIQSLLDQDYYTFTVQQIAFHRFSDTIVRYRFKCRNKAVWTYPMLAEIKRELFHFCMLRFDESEIEYLRTLPELQKDYIDWLVDFQPGIEYVCVWIDERGELQVCIEGPWKETVIFEVPLLSIINEVYYKHILDINDYNKILPNGSIRALEKIKSIKPCVDYGFKYVEMGTRRRFSFDHHLNINSIIRGTSAGTSNVYFSKINGTKPVGTMSHQYIMVGAGLGNVNLQYSPRYMLYEWYDEYGDALNVALTDTYGIDAFLRDYNDGGLYEMFPGLRHDSGCPYVWTDKVLKKCEQMGVDKKSRKFVYSDGLDFFNAIKIWRKYADLNQLFGIGTWLTNDLEKVTPLQIVMKIVRVNGLPVAKISDSPGKGMCENPVYERFVRKVFQIP